MDDWYHSHYHSLISELDDNLIGLTIAMVTWLVGWLALTCIIMQLVDQIIHGGINPSNEHCWKQLTATTIRKRSKQSAEWGNWFIS